MEERKRVASEEIKPEVKPAIAEPGFFRGLSGRLLLLTVIFVMVAEVMIFVPSVATMRLRWLSDRLNTAAAAAVTVAGLDNIELPRAVQDETLMATGTKTIALRRQDASRLIATVEDPVDIYAQYDMADVSSFDAIRDALDTLIFGGNRTIRVYGPIGESDQTIDVVMRDRNLRKAMLTYARNVFILSFFISLITATLIFVAVNRLTIVPLRRIIGSMQDFASHPSDPDRVLVPTDGRDEISIAGQHLAAMQTQLQRTLREQKNLAELGLAVSKINHDMRNILSSAQLISDRLNDVDDPIVKRFAPKLLRTIDRAVGYTTDVLAYGGTREEPPNRRKLQLQPLVADVSDMLGLDGQSDITFAIEVDETIEIDADGEQIFRVIHNLCRNAMQALTADETLVQRKITVSALRIGSVVSISVDDTGPGMPQKAREHLFTAFRGSVRSGGTGLGLAIAREIVLAHGGTIALVEKPTSGTLFRIELPDQPVSLDTFRNRLRH